MLEFGLLSKWDRAHFAVFSSVDGEAGCAVTAIFSCYSHDDSLMNKVKVQQLRLSNSQSWSHH
jgi:hypothetical protein